MKSKLLAVAGLVLISTAGQASAAIVEVTVNGTVTSSVDLTGIFGIVDTGNAYVGDSYVASIIFNPSLGETQSTSTYNTAEGGSADPTPNLTNPALSANVTINGVTVSINPINFGEFVGDNNENGLGISGQHYNVGYYSNNMLLNNCCNFIKIQEDIAASDLSIPLSLTTPFTYNVDSDPAASESAATFYLTDRDNNGVYEQFTVIDASIQTLTLSVVTPLPDALPLFATGLGVMALVGWRRKRKNAAATAAGPIGDARASPRTSPARRIAANTAKLLELMA